MKADTAKHNTDRLPAYPQVKFLQRNIPDILAHIKTMEVRPRSARWANRVANSPVIALTHGARFSPAKVFALAQVQRVEIKPFAQATAEDVRRFGQGWQHKPVAQFSAAHEGWYAKELGKGHPVVWIYFELIPSSVAPDRL